MTTSTATPTPPAIDPDAPGELWMLRIPDGAADGWLRDPTSGGPASEALGRVVALTEADAREIAAYQADRYDLLVVPIRVK